MLCRTGSPIRLDLASLAAAFTGIVGYSMVALPLGKGGLISADAVDAVARFVADHAEEALREVHLSETHIAEMLPDLAVADEVAQRSTGAFLIAARRWLSDACQSGDVVWRRDVDPAVEQILADQVVAAR